MLSVQPVKQYIKKNKPTIVFILTVVIFSIYALYIALHLQPDIIPDEKAHFAFAKYFSTTWVIPSDTHESYQWGWYIEHNPILSHWINGCIINLIRFFNPSVTDLTILIILRVINTLFALGTILFCFMLSKQIFTNKWWQLFPVFLLTNTLMFVFLAGGLNYDNLVNLLSMAGLYFFVCSFTGKNFIHYSLAWMIFIAIGTLAKFTILPLALVMSFAWVVYLIINKRKLLPIKPNGAKTLILASILVLLIIWNFAIYGINLIKFHSLRPACIDILNESQCEASPYFTRHQEIALEKELTVIESIKMGYPNPIEYISNSWIRNLFLGIYGILGHQYYYPIKIIDYYQLLFYIGIVIGILFWKKSTFTVYSLIGICIFYTLVLLCQNYQNELIYGFRHIALQGRYIFPVIAPIYIIFTKILISTPSKALRWAILIFTIGLFIYGGPLTLILKYDTAFSSWFF